MPPTGRRRARKDPNPEPAEAENPDMTNTPTRKRRRVNGNSAPRKSARTTRSERAATNESEGTVAQEHVSDDETTWTKQLDYAAKFISKLKTASYHVTAATIYNNDKLNMERQDAYARVSGRDWTYFVRDTSFNIGRPVKAANPKSGIDSSPSGGTRSVGGGADFLVDIDLGPDQQVSRIHAVVEFQPNEGQWAITVNGRNGLVVDETRYERGEQAWLHSGAVISILGTQMMFTLPEQQFVVHPSIIAQTSEDGMSEDEFNRETQVPPASQRAPTSNARQNGSQQSTQTRGQGSASQQTRSQQQLAAAPSLPGTPLTVRSKEAPQPKSKASPAYGRGMLLETTEDIDYSLDNSRDIKPPHSYAQLIGQAILASTEEKLTLAKIYDFIKEHYAFYRFSGGGWQNSIRHNLSLSKSFEKVARRTDEPGKGMKWQIVPEYRDEFVKKNMTNPRKGLLRVGSSGPNSPSTGVPAQATERLQGAIYYDHLGQNPAPAAHQMDGAKSSPRSTTPPLGGYPANENFTPERGPSRDGGMPSLANNASVTQTPVFSRSRSQLAGAGNTADASATTSGGSSRATALTDAATGSPVMLGASRHAQVTGPTPGGLYGDYPHANMALQTPLTRYKPRLAPPSTAHVPSQHMLFSSPAPFWKYANLGSTPAKPLEGLESPVKKANGDNADDDDDAAAEEVAETMIGNKKVAPESAEDMVAAPEDSEQNNTATAAQPSSPPLPPTSHPPALSLEGLDATSGDDEDVSPNDVSPSRTISRPVSRQLPGGPTIVSQSQAPMPKLNLGAAPVLNATTGNGMGAARATAGASSATAQAQRVGSGIRGGEEGGIDLAKGFQRIGSYHRSLSQSGGLSLPPHATGGIIAPRG